MHQNGNGNAPLVSEQVELPTDTDSQPWLRVLETEMAAAQMRARLLDLAARRDVIEAEYSEVLKTLTKLEQQASRAGAELQDALTAHYARRNS